MATRVIDQSRTVSGTAYDLPGNGQTIQVVSWVEITGTNGGGAFYLPGNNNRLILDGAARGAVAVNLGDDPGDRGNSLVVTGDGRAVGTAYGAMLRGSGHIENDGTIHGDDLGVFLLARGDRPISVTNGGTIDGDWYGIFANSFDGQTNYADVTLRNDRGGVIGGDDAAVRLGLGNDQVTNRGTLEGHLLLEGGNDVLDDRGGTIHGEIRGNGGRDRFIVGASAETVIGGSGTDTLDFRDGDGLTVSLARPWENTGRARGDSYSGIERIWGSQHGADRLVGDGGANTLVGYQGADRLSGGGGDDVLIGGVGADRLAGGGGSDRFLFQDAGQAGDRIDDFGWGDHLVVEAAGFGAGLVAGAGVTDDQFGSGDSNEAGSGAERFLFRTWDATLWFDANGSGSGGLRLLADLQDGVQITASDILIA